MAAMSTDMSHSPTGRSAAFAQEARDPLLMFVADAHAVAAASDPMLAGLLANILGPRPACARDTWRGDRREALELCRRLLSYVRQDVADRRLDVSLGYIAIELEGLRVARSGNRLTH